MIGEVRLIKRYTRWTIRENKNEIFVFGDNIARTGYGGQAASARDEPNVVGIPTKWRPAMDEAAFFKDDDLDAVIPFIWGAFQTLQMLKMYDKTIWWPEDGIGTGLSQLSKRAPAINAYINSLFRRLKDA
jgi:hypothetical protein